MTDPRTPENIWPIDAEYLDSYLSHVKMGTEYASQASVAIVAIARNAMPFITNTMPLIKEVADLFRESKVFVYENDSTDGTDQYLKSLDWLTSRHAAIGGDDTRGFEAGRTQRLAACRSVCQDWVRALPKKPDVTIVFDTDPHGGFSVGGVMNSLSWLGEKMSEASAEPPAGMAAYSLYRAKNGTVAQYDAWAMRPTCWWRDRRAEIGNHWAHYFMPPVGAPPVAMNSAFGGLCVYGTDAYLSGKYCGDNGDCEHVSFHKSMLRAGGYRMYLNPGCRYFAYDETI